MHPYIFVPYDLDNMKHFEVKDASSDGVGFFIESEVKDIKREQL